MVASSVSVLVLQAAASTTDHKVAAMARRPIQMAADCTHAGTVASGSGRYAIVIHGGAGVINSTNEAWLESALGGLQQALAAGSAVLREGGSAVDAVEAAVRHLEDDAHFNAG
eukprot:jgi/Chrzof1/1501/Cz10g10060.t1